MWFTHFLLFAATIGMSSTAAFASFDAARGVETWREARFWIFAAALFASATLAMTWYRA